jgi:hypothetical protein
VEAGRVAWCTAKRGFCVNVTTDVALHEASGASVARRDRDVNGAAREVPSEVWGTPRGGTARVREHSVAIAPFDAVITLLDHNPIA